MPYCQLMSYLIVLCAGCYASFTHGSTVKGEPGRSVHLPCSYNTGYHGILHMCWQKGPCYPFSSGCSPELIKTNGRKVTQSSSDRYRLNGNLRRGNVTLTIGEVSEEDSGEYCCRVEIPGFLNDEFSAVNLNISAGIPHTSSEWAVVTVNYLSEDKNIEGGAVSTVIETEENGILILVSLIVTVVLISILVIILVLRKKIMNAIKINADARLHLNESIYSELQRDTRAVDNIYSVL